MDSKAIHCLSEIKKEYQEIDKANDLIFKSIEHIRRQQDIMCRFLTVEDLVLFDEIYSGEENLLLGKHGFVYKNDELQTAIIHSVKKKPGGTFITFTSAINNLNEVNSNDVYLLKAEL